MTSRNATRASVALVLVTVLGLSGCQTWRTTPIPVDQVIAVERPSTIRVAKRDGSTVTLHNPTFSDFTLTGEVSCSHTEVFTADAAPTPLCSVETIAAPQIASVQVRRFSAVRTGLLGAVSVVAFVLFKKFFDDF